MGIMELMNESNYLCLWDNLGTRNRVKNILLQTFLLFHDLVDSEVYPKEWSVMRLTATGKTMLRTMQELAKPLVLYFKDVENFDNQVINFILFHPLYFRVLLSLFQKVIPSTRCSNTFLVFSCGLVSLPWE